MESEMFVIRKENEKYSREIHQYEKDYFDLITEKQQLHDNYEQKLAKLRENQDYNFKLYETQFTGN